VVVTLKERILDKLKKASEPLTPKQIHARTRINHNTVKVYVRQLLTEGLISQPYPGAYSYKTHPRSGEPPPRVQNLILSVSAPWLSNRVKTVEEKIGDIGIRVLFGVKRRKITCYISRDQGLDYVQMVMAWELFRMYVALNGGPMLDVDEVKVQSCEVLRDYEQLRLDGVKCVTVKSFLGALERVYNREHGLRSEVKVQPQDVNTIMTLLKGGVSSYNILQGQFMIVQEIRHLTEAVKGSNRLTSTLISWVKDLMERRLRDE
jgi:hypothetical protein